MTSVGEHFRSTDEAVPSGIYRVVGTSETVTLLRVGDEDGRRRYTGEIVSVQVADFERAFEPAEDPDERFDPLTSAWNAIRNLYWSPYAVWLSVQRRLR